ncbi:MAG: MFS transporter [Calditrichaeota bacterium]|nr:MAG: MFS transporter [Calditrichota bacterium]
MEDTKNRSRLDRILCLFTDVRAGEGGTALLLMFDVFLVLTSYYIAKVVREPLILTGGGAELKSYSSAGQAILLVAAVRLYAWLASRLHRRRLIHVVNMFFSICLVLFYGLAQLHVPIGIVYFLWVGMFSVMVVAQFWSFANDIYTPEAGKRLFPLVAFGTSLGAVFGSYIAGRLIPILGVYQLMLVAGGVLLLSLLFTDIVDKRERRNTARSVAARREPSIEEALDHSGAFKLVFQHKYLLMIALLILLLNWVNTTGEYILSRTVEETANRLAKDGKIAGFSVEEYIGKFYADFFTVVNLAGVLIQLFLVSRIFKYLGIRIALFVLPLIALGGYVLLAFYPVLSFVRWAKTAENATDYSLNNTVRHALFLPTTREEKYKAKQAIDSFFHRSGDVLSAVFVFAGVHWLAFDTRRFALVNLGLVTVWLVLAYRIGLENRRLMQKAQAQSGVA